MFIARALGPFVWEGNTKYSAFFLGQAVEEMSCQYGVIIAVPKSQLPYSVRRHMVGAILPRVKPVSWNNARLDVLKSRRISRGN